MIPISLFCLTAGLVLGVFAMLYGTERRRQPVSPVLPLERTSEHDPSAEPRPVFNLASVAAFVLGFGATGYALATRAEWPIAVQVVVAAAVGGALLGLQSLLIARWAIPSARAEHVDERFLLQGTLGRITAEIPAQGTGAMHYVLDGREATLPARAMDGGAVARGDEVVIDRIEDGVAFVERWSDVEQRL